MATRTPEVYELRAGEWMVCGCDGDRFRTGSYDEALAEFERQVELYRQPERKRLLGYRRSDGALFLFSMSQATSGFQRAPWLDEPEEG